MDPLTLWNPLPGLVLLLLSVVGLVARHFRADALVEVLGSVEPEDPFLERT